MEYSTPVGNNEDIKHLLEGYNSNITSTLQLVADDNNEGTILVDVAGGNVIVDTENAVVGDSALATITNGNHMYEVKITVIE